MKNELLTGRLLDDECTLTLSEMSHACRVHAEWIIELVDEGILEPVGYDARHWLFSGPSLSRARTVMHLQHDLGVNLAGAALVLDLMDEIKQMRAHLNMLEDNT